MDRGTPASPHLLNSLEGKKEKKNPSFILHEFFTTPCNGRQFSMRTKQQILHHMHIIYIHERCPEKQTKL